MRKHEKHQTYENVRVYGLGILNTVFLGLLSFPFFGIFLGSILEVNGIDLTIVQLLLLYLSIVALVSLIPAVLFLALSFILNVVRFLNRRIATNLSDKLIAGRDKREYILFLRPFLFHGTIQRRAESLETKLARLIEHGVPVVALAPETDSARENLPINIDTGLDWYFIPNTPDWLRLIRSHIKRAELIVCVPSAFRGTALEVGEIIAAQAFHKTIFVCPGNITKLQTSEIRSLAKKHATDKYLESATETFRLVYHDKIPHPWDLDQEKAHKADFEKLEAEILERQEIYLSQSLVEPDPGLEWDELFKRFPSVDWPQFCPDGFLFQIVQQEGVSYKCQRTITLDTFFQTEFEAIGGSVSRIRQALGVK